MSMAMHNELRALEARVAALEEQLKKPEPFVIPQMPKTLGLKKAS